jgi:TolA-binding protein
MRICPWPVRAAVALLVICPFTSGRGQEPAADVDPGEREARLLFNTASRLYRERSWGEAVQVFGEFLDRNPRHADAPQARFARGYSLARLGRHAEAVADLRASVAKEDTPWAAEACFHLGRSLEALAEKEPADSPARKSGLRAAAESHGRAARLASRAAPTPADSSGSKAPAFDLKAVSLAAQGEALYKAGLFSEALEALEPIAAAPAQGSGVSARGLYTLALAHLALAPAGGAKEAHGAAARKLLVRVSGTEFSGDSLADDASFLLARLLHDDGDRKQAIERYAALARKGGPHAAEAACSRAIALYEGQAAGDLAAAQAELGKFIAQNPGHALAPRARLYEALCSFDLKRYGEAAEKLGALKAPGEEPPALASLRLGQALLLKEPAEPQAALAALDRAARALAASKDGGKLELVQAVYWQGEARLALGGDSLGAAARAFGEVAERHRDIDPPLAEKALYQEARALYLAGDRRGAARTAKLYRERYPREKGRFYLESLKLSAENGRRAGAGDLEEEERGAVAGYYEAAASLEKDPVETRRLRYLTGIALYERGSWPEAAEALGKVDAESRAARLDGFDEPELAFFLADALIRAGGAGAAAGAPLERERLERAARLLGEFLARAPSGPRTPAALLDLGLARERLGDPAAARKCFEKLLADHPGHAVAPEARLRLANSELALGDLAAAAAEYLRAAGEAKDPAASGRSRLQAAILLRRLKKPDQALAALKEIEGDLARKLSSGDEGRAVLRDAEAQRALALCDTARAALDAGEARKALQTIESLLGARPEAGSGAAAAGRDQALYLRAWCFDALAAKAQGDEKERCSAEVESSYRRLLAECPRSDLAADARVELGQRLFNRKAYPEAREMFAAARASLEKKSAGGPAAAPGAPAPADGHSPDLLGRALFGLGFLAYEEKDFAAAHDLFDRAAASGGKDLAPRATFQAARAWMQERGDQEAAERFARLLEDPSPRAAEMREEVLLRLGECRTRLGDHQGAAAVLKEMIEKYPRGPLRHEGLFALGLARQLEKDHPAAVKAYRQVVAETDAPVAARAQYHLGESLMDQGMPREAAREFLTVVANFDFEGPYREWVRRALLAAGLAYQAAGDPATARKQFEELVKRFPESEEGRAAAERLGEKQG